MTMPTWENETLLAEYALALLLLEEARHNAGVYEQEIMRRMREQGAIAIPSEEYLCELETRNTYDASRFTPLKELLTWSDLESAFTAAHSELVTVPEKWDTRKLLALARRYGGAVARIVEEAKVTGNPKLKFERKEVK